MGQAGFLSICTGQKSHWTTSRSVFKLRKPDTLVKITCELARIHAHICGDGCAYVTKWKRSPADLESHPRKDLIKREWCIKYTNTCRELLDEFSNDMKSQFNRKSTPQNDELKFNGCRWIIKLLNLENKNSYTWFIPEFIMNASSNVACNWLRAFLDDEGTVDSEGKRIRVKSMNEKGLLQTKSLFSKISIFSKVTGPNCDNSFYLTIYKEGLLAYERKVGFIHPEKKLKLKKLNGAGRTFNRLAPNT